MENDLRNNKEKKEENNSFLDYNVIYKIITIHWQWILLSVIICLSVSFAYLRYTAPVYRVIAKLLIKDDEGNRKYNLQNVTNLGTISQNYGLENETQIISSSIIAEKAITNLKLYVSYKETGRLFNKTLYKRRPITVDIDPEHLHKINEPIHLNIKYKNNLYYISGTYYVPIDDDTATGPYHLEKTTKDLPLQINTKAGTITISNNPGISLDEPINMEVTIRSPQAIANIYTNNITVEPTSEGSSVIKLIVNDKIPSRAIEYLRQLIDCYNQQANEDKNEVAVRTEAFINERLAIINEELGHTDGNLEQYKRNNQLVELKTDARESSKNEAIYKQKLKDANTQIALVKEIESMTVHPDITQLLPQISIQDITANSLIDEYNKVVMNRNRLLRTASECSPIVEPLTERLKELSLSIQTSLRQARNNATIIRDAIAEQHGQYSHEIISTPEQERVLTQISRQQEVKSGLYLMLLQKREENTISLAATVDKGKIIEEPTIAGIIKPRSSLIYPIAMILGLVIPILIFYIRHLQQKYIEGHEDVSALTSLPILADIPLVSPKDDSSYIVVHENENNLMEESFRYLRTNLQFMLSNKEKVILFTSTNANEGKSFNAVNTAVSFALLGKKVIVVGLDIRNPQLAKIFGINGRTQGITNLLTQNTLTDHHIEELIIQSQVHENLDLLLAGTIPPNPAELVARSSLEHIFDYLRNEYDYVIVDAAPVGLVTDTLLIGRVCDLTVYVIRSNYTLKNSLTLVNNLEDEKKLPHMSIIINGINLSSKRYNYAYGYGQYGRFNQKNK